MLLDTPLCAFGWTPPALTLPDTDGQPHRLAVPEGARALLVAFICNHCPYVKAIIDRLVADARLLEQDGVAVLAVMSNDFDAYPEDSPARMRQFAAAHGMGFPYLVDAEQVAARAYGAVCTPDFFGFNAAGQLQYRGRLDDAGIKPQPRRHGELLDAMRQIAASGQGPREQHPSMGCSIKWR